MAKMTEDKSIIYFQTKNLEQKNIKELSNGDIQITGYASTKNIDSYQDIVNPDAFEKHFDTFKRNPVMLLGHNMDKAIGEFISAKITKQGLKVVGIIKHNDDNVKEKVLSGTLKSFSIGFRIKKVKYKEDKVNNRIIRIIEELELKEISIVSVPANPFTLFQSVKNFFNNITKQDMENMIKQDGIEILSDNISGDELKAALDYIRTKSDNTDEVKTDETDVEDNSGNIAEEIATDDEKSDEVKETEKKDDSEIDKKSDKELLDGSEKSDEISDDTSKSDEVAPKSDESNPETKTEDEEETISKADILNLLEVVNVQAKQIDSLNQKLNSIPVSKGLVFSKSLNKTETKNDNKELDKKSFLEVTLTK